MDDTRSRLDESQDSGGQNGWCGAGQDQDTARALLWPEKCRDESGVQSESDLDEPTRFNGRSSAGL